MAHRATARAFPRSAPHARDFDAEAGRSPKDRLEWLGHASIGITLDTDSHVLPGMQEMAAEAFEVVLNVGKPLENGDFAPDQRAG